MSKRYIIFVILALIGIIILLIIKDLSSTGIGNRSENEHEFDVEKYKHVDSSLIGFKETKRLNIKSDNPAAVDFANGLIYLAVKDEIQIVNFETGRKTKTISSRGLPTCIHATDKDIACGFKNYIKVINPEGSTLFKTEKQDSKAYYTAIAKSGDTFFVADAGNRKIIKFNDKGEQIGEFEGHKAENERHGFIVPSPYFDLAINAFDELWIVNPGKHRIENYTFDGRLIGFWEKTSINIEGFSGCCNPAHFDIMPDGTFVTSEKGMVRVKTYKPSGELISVVAAPVKFGENHQAPDITVVNDSTICLLDYGNNRLRIFTKK